MSAATDDAFEPEPPSIDDVPTWFGLFKPVGWLMVGLPTQPQAEALETRLHEAGWTDTTLLRFTPGESLAQLEAMAEDPGPLAGFGYELPLVQRYVERTQQGYAWRLVKVDGDEQAAQAADMARQGGATLAVHYRSLTIEELI